MGTGRRAARSDAAPARSSVPNETARICGIDSWFPKGFRSRAGKRCSGKHPGRKPGRMGSRRGNRAVGFSLLELIFVIAVHGLLLALLLPAVQSVRAGARRLQCAWNLQQLALACHQYEHAYRAFPPGTVDRNTPVISRRQGYHHNWLVRLLPYLGDSAAAQAVNFNVSVYAPANAPLRRQPLAVAQCPDHRWSAAPRNGPFSASYAACHHHVEAPISRTNQGAFIQDRALRRRAFPDGLAHTLFLGDKLDLEGDLGWYSGTRATLRNTGTPPNQTAAAGTRPWWAPRAAGPQFVPQTPLQVGGFGARHAGGVVNFALGDGHVARVLDEIDLGVLQALAHRRDAALGDRTLYRDH